MRTLSPKMILLLSPLTQGRELKHDITSDEVRNLKSPLTQGRELKHFYCIKQASVYGRPSRRGVN